MSKQFGMEELERALARLPLEPADRQYVYVETGRYKPYGVAVIAAAKRRGYGVKRFSAGVYYVYPKPEQVNP